MNLVRNIIKKILQKIKQHKKITIICLIIIVIVLILLFIFINNDDGMKSQDEIDIYYRTYTEEEGWSKWSKNGSISGDTSKNYKILKIQMKTNKKYQDYLSYSVYSDEEGWLSNYDEVKAYEIKGFKIKLTDTYSKKYDICYRTYNEEDGWLDWTCNANKSGNKNISITAIEVKIIPKNSIKSEYLKDYKDYDNQSSIGF